MTQEEIDALPDHLALRLRQPIEFGGKSYSELVLGEPTSAQLREISRKTGPDATITAVALTAGVLPGVAEQLKARDLVKAEAFFSRFLETAQAAHPQTGAPS